ncbi:MAG: YerC/YecD family TrpR-related protein [Patescibacteria group bacterium]
MNKKNSKKTEELYQAMLSLKNTKEAVDFFRDLLTEKEIIELGNRWRAARMLNQNIPYSKIIEDTGLSSTTIARTSKWLKKSKGGFRLILQRINTHRHNSSVPEKGLF